MEAAAQETALRVPYRVRMNHIEACNCNVGCSCQFVGFPDRDGCEFMIAYEMTEGSYGDVDLAGVRAVVGMVYPGAIHEGNGRGVLFVDESVSDEQADALAEIFYGRAGGMPWEALAGTFESFEGPIRKPIEISAAGTRSSFRVPGVCEVVQRPVKDPVSGEDKNVHIRYPDGGFFWEESSVCTTDVMRMDYDGLRFEHPGWFASTAVAEWTNQA